jgi:1-deoxy-D-xylulose-5-phosphate reductoisomerase
MKKKIISILGSTGSIGLTTLSVINKKKEYFKINILSANKNFRLICSQIRKYKPNLFIVNDKNIYEKIKKKFKNVNISNNFDIKNNIKKSDITITAIPGIAGLKPTISIIKFSKNILIANKESIICGWDLIKKEALKFKTNITPIDSEHFSILKLIKNHNLKDIEKIYITASGGPFLNYTKKKLKTITPKDAVKHPKWRMGKKISVDSSTLINKVFELVEAQKLFNIPNNKIDILIHPNSLVHAIIEFKNGLTEFMYHATSMKVPIANAIFDGNLNIIEFFKEKKEKLINEKLIFKKVDKEIFPIINFKNKFNEFASTPIIINATNEILVDQFLRKKIPYLAIFGGIKTILNNRNYKKYAIRKPKNINQIKTIDQWARSQAIKITTKT